MEEEWPQGTKLRALLTGGDKLHRAPKGNFPFILYNHYGPTENTVVATYTMVSPTLQSDILPPIGRPISNVQIFLLDSNLKPVPIGVPGEIFIGGAGVARGYCNRPGVTAEKFIPDPFSRKPGAHLYQTGDLARYLPDGNIDFLGRLDQQIKIRGFRIELGEIESVLGLHQAVRENVAIAREDTPHEIRLVSYVVLNPGQVLTGMDLRGFLKEKLPAFMIPSKFVLLEKLPFTPNGKIDRRALPKPNDDFPENDVPDILPRTDVEKKIGSIWKEVLNLEKVGLMDNFFDLGGHSLLVIQVRTRLEKFFGKKISMMEMFQYPTISTLSEFFNQDPEGPSTSHKLEESTEKRKELMMRRKKQRKKEKENQGEI